MEKAEKTNEDAKKALEGERKHKEEAKRERDRKKRNDEKKKELLRSCFRVQIRVSYLICFVMREKISHASPVAPRASFTEDAFTHFKRRNQTKQWCRAFELFV